MRVIGESFVEANSEEEARHLAEEGKDTNYDELDTYADIYEIEEVEDGLIKEFLKKT